VALETVGSLVTGGPATCYTGLGDTVQPPQVNLENLTEHELKALPMLASQGIARVGDLQRVAGVKGDDLRKLLNGLAARRIIEDALPSVSPDELPWMTVVIRSTALPFLNQALLAKSSQP
jgi:hypothetical protein